MSNNYGLSDGFGNASAEQINRTRLSYGSNDNKLGLLYVVQLLQLRTMIDKDGNRGFFFDCVVPDIEVPAGGSPAGTEFTYKWYPDPKAIYKAKKEGELKRSLGAFYGFDATASTSGVDTQKVVQSFVDVGHSQALINQGVYTPLRGRLARVQARPYFAKESQEWTTLYDFKPYIVDGKTVDRPVVQLAAPAPQTSAASPQNAAPPPPVSAPFPPAGWLPHTNPTYAAQGWYYEVANPNNMKTEAQLRAA